MIEQLTRNAKDFGVPFIGMKDSVRQGIMHVVAVRTQAWCIRAW